MDTSFETKGDYSKDEWLTPPEIIRALGDFDLDPCAPVVRPWDMAKKHYTYLDNGLMMPWEGRVWCNPLYGRQTAAWLEKCAIHGSRFRMKMSRFVRSFTRINRSYDRLMFLNKTNKL